MEIKETEKKYEIDEMSLKDVVLILRKWYSYVLSKWIFILGFSILGGIGGFAYAWFKKPIYTATTTFVLEEGEKGGGIGQYAGLASMVGIDLGSGGGGIFQGDNILELYKSRAMIEKTLLTEVQFGEKKELLVNRYIEFNKLRKKWDKKPYLKDIQFKIDSSGALAPTTFKRTQDSILGTIVNDINKNYLNVAKPDKKLSIIKADVKSSDEVFAKNFDDQIVRNVNDFYIQTKTKKAIANVVILQHKTDSVRAVMNGAIYTAAAVADATPNLNITRQVQRIAPVQRSQFNAETNKAVLSELLKNLELSKMGLLKETPLIQVIDQPIFPLEKDDFGRVKGAIIGAVLFGFLCTVIILIRKIIKNISL